MSKPIVAVVGRPNVGKSTCSISCAASALPLWRIPRALPATAFLPTASGTATSFCWWTPAALSQGHRGILAHMREQAQIAIDTADCIIMVTDVRDGLTAADEDVAHMLRRSHKPSFLP